MAKKQFVLSVQDKHLVKKGKHIFLAHLKDNEIDFTDIPNSTDRELKKATRLGRPKSDQTKQLIAIRISPKLLNRIKLLAKKAKKPYQTYIQILLEKSVS